jgi:4a-hydroxytetrahydrobiopterin dehydratase
MSWVGRWIERDGALHLDVQFHDFTEAFGFMCRVALVAERMGHHPDWSNSWNRVSIRLTTHDAGGIVTERDRALADAIDEILA